MKKGRQIEFYMLPEDRDAFLEFVRKSDPVLITEMVGEGPDASPVVLSEQSQWLCLWNWNLLPHLNRALVHNAAHEPFRIDEIGLPVLEFSTSFRVIWDGRPAIGQGRVYGFFEGKSAEFEKWFERLVRWIRKNFRKSPTNMGGYVGPAAYEFYEKGGYLLPNFVPPKTEEWLTEIHKQHHQKRKR